MKYDFDRIIPRRGTRSLKWDSGELLKTLGYADRFDDDTIPLFVADMDFPCPQPVLDALRKRVGQQMFGYTYHLADGKFNNAVKSWFLRRQGWKIADESIVYCPGTVYALNAAVRAFTKPGDGIIIQRPVYPPFTRAAEENGRVILNNELINDHGFYRIDFDDLERKASAPNTSMMILCSPHNPVGRIWTPEELRRIDRICKAGGVLLISDEIHGDLIRSGETFYPLAAAAGTENAVICTAINKTFNTAGLHCSNIIIDDPVRRKAFQKQLDMKSPSPFAISALIAAYNEGEDWLEQLKVYLDGNFDFLEKFLRDRMPDVRFRRPEGTYIAWLDFSGTGLSPEAVHERIYVQANVLLEDGRIFGEASESFQRLCVPAPRSVLQTAMQRIASAFGR